MAAAQAVAVPGDVARNVATAARLVARAGAGGARLVVLPELFLPGYHPPTLAAHPDADVDADADGEVTDTRLEALRGAARTAGSVVLVGAAVRAPDGARHLSTLVVAADGGVREAYRKQNLCPPEETALFTAGCRGTVLDLDGWLVGLAVCYDGCFPEHARGYAQHGAHVYACSSAYRVGAEHRRDVYYRARAVENGLFVVLADAVGGPEPYCFGGGSAVLDPESRALGRARAGQEDVVVADLDPALLVATRDRHTMLADLSATTGPGTPRRLTG
ncbi:carbon-nitrogen hydrolase family protein [Thalassiella azotivora]